MRLRLAALLLAAAPLLSAPAGLAAQTAPVAEPAGTAVRDDGLVATWYPPASGKRGPVILVLGGSEGGDVMVAKLGAAMAAHGYGVLALAYFRVDGLPPQFEEIPLEYFDRALAWIARQPLADADRIGLYGISKGAETALLLASRSPAIKAVAAAVPSSVVWQGINYADYTSVRSSFSLGGRPVPYVPYDTSAAFTGVLDLYQRSLRLIPEHPDAVIPVERIAGPVLLLSAKGDSLWPSTEMAEQVMARLDAKGFRYAHRHIAFADAGHAALSPLRPGASNSPADNLGGTEAGNAAAHADAWAKTLAFFDESLGGPSR